MSHIVVSDPFHVAQAHRQQRLRAFAGLHLALLVHLQHQAMLGRVEVKPHDIAHLLNEERIGREHKASRAMRLQPEQRQVALHGGRRRARGPGQAAARTMRSTLRPCFERGIDQRGDLLFARAPWPAGFKPDCADPPSRARDSACDTG